MSSLLSADLVATCNALGYNDEEHNKYYADDNTLETVKDLIRYLRRDDPTFNIRRQLGETKVMQTDLLPLLKSYWQQSDLFDVLLRLIVNLTTPALILWHEEIPNDTTGRNQYLQIEEHLRLYKQAFADEAIWAVLSTRISKILEIDSVERGDENGLIIERILILIRNVLYVPADPDAEKRPDNDASVHDQVLWSLHQSGLLDIILYMSSSESEQVYYMHILEILSYMLREQSATELANAALQRSQTEKMRDEAELLALRHRESKDKQRKVKKYNSTRHSHFGGTFVVKSMQSISDNDLIYHRPLNKLESLNFDTEKKKSKTPRNRLPVQNVSTERRSAFSIRLFLKEFCVEFLKASYNTLMYHVKGRLARARGQQHDDTYYLWALRFFMEFNRCHKFEVKLVSETMSVQSFHFVQQKMENHYDMITSDKKFLKLWSRRLHLALLAYRELLMTIFAMDKSPDASVRSSSKVIKSNVFYVLEYRELILTLLVTYDELKMSPGYLRDLIETQHIFLKMLEDFCGGKDGRVMVQAKNKTRRKKKATSVPSAVPELNLDNMWDEVSPQLSVVLEGNIEIPSDVVPFDAGSDEPIDEQKSEAMVRIQRKLRSHEFEGAIALLRASREVWPENDCFGTEGMPVEEEFMALREVFFADLGENDPPPPETPVHEEEDEEDEEDEVEESMRITESDFKFSDFTKRLAHPKIIRACALALAQFDKNTLLTNHCIIKLLHRIAVDTRMFAMLFQVSLFVTFQKIYDADHLPQNKELVKFATYIMRQFFEAAQKNPHVFMESLFWKSSRDAYDIEEGYGSYQERSKAATKAWTELEEDELRRLFMEHKENQIQDDVVDWILNNLINTTRSRRMVLKKLKDMFLLVDYRPRKSGVSAKVPRQWSGDEEAQLTELYEQFKDAMDPLTCIMDRLDVHRPKNRISEKLLVMGLVQDKKELRKKRSRKSHGPQGAPRRSCDDDVTTDDSDCSDDDSAPRSTAPGPSKPTSKKSKRGGKNKSSRHVRFSAGEIARTLIGLVDGDMSEALDWLKESFTDASEDMTNDPDDSEEGIPLVPILDCAVSAMEDPEFLKLLKAFGVQEPSDEQETYWRISVSIDPSELRAHCEMLTQAIEKTLIVPEETVTLPEPNDGGQESSDEDVFDKLRKFTANEENVTTETFSSSGVQISPVANRERNDAISNELGESTQNNEIGNRRTRCDTIDMDVATEDKFDQMIEKTEQSKKDRIQSLLKKTAGKKSRVELDIIHPSKSKEKPSTSKNKRRIQLVESSDDETSRGPSEENPDEFAMFKRARIVDSDSEPETQTIRNILGSDDSGDESFSSQPQFKPMKIISSSDEDDTENDQNVKLPVKRSSNRLILDSEDDDNESTGTQKDINNTKDEVLDVIHKKPLQSKIRFLDSDSDSNGDCTKNSNENTKETSEKPNRDQYEKAPKSARSMMDSDDDSNDDINLQLKVDAAHNDLVKDASLKSKSDDESNDCPTGLVAKESFSRNEEVDKIKSTSERMLQISDDSDDTNALNELNCNGDKNTKSSKFVGISLESDDDSTTRSSLNNHFTNEEEVGVAKIVSDEGCLVNDEDKEYNAEADCKRNRAFSDSDSEKPEVKRSKITDL